MGVSRKAEPGPIERATPSDLVMLAMDRKGGTPEQLGAVLVLDARPGTDVAAVERAVASRIRRIPRLRQRLVKVPPGCGRPVWVDDPDDPTRHIRRLRCAAPGDEQALLDLAAEIITDPLPRSRPLWSATVVTGLIRGRVGLVIVLHHVVADGIGGLAVLQHLVDAPAGTDDAAAGATRAFPRPRPPWAVLACDALRSRLRGLTRLPAAARALRTSFAAVGGVHPPPATPCSLLRPTGRRRRLTAVHTDLAELRAAAHRHGGTVNDAVLAAVAGALRTLLGRRGEHVEQFRIGLMVARRRSTSVEALGNTATPLLVDVPAGADPGARLAAIAGTVRTLRACATEPPPIALVAPLFRAIAALGLFRWYMARQRRMHTLTSNIHGPDRTLAVAGIPIESIIPISAGEVGNITAGFVVLSYAGTLTITIVADGDQTPDLPALASALEDELDALVRSSAGRTAQAGRG
jgi:diacylglycerol O-acyltransferase / wax synthase